MVRAEISRASTQLLRQVPSTLPLAKKEALLRICWASKEYALEAAQLHNIPVRESQKRVDKFKVQGMECCSCLMVSEYQHWTVLSKRAEVCFRQKYPGATNK